MSGTAKSRFIMDNRRQNPEFIAIELLRATSIKDVARLRSMVSLSEWNDIVNKARELKRLQNAGT